MKRRDFVKNSIAVGAATVAGGSVETVMRRSSSSENPPEVEPFTLKYAPEPGLFAHHANDLIDQITFAHDHGFMAWEDNGLVDRSVRTQEAISQTIQQLGMEFGEFVGHMTFEEVTFAGDDEPLREQVLQEVRESVEIAQRMNTKIVHIVLGQSHPRLAWGYQMANATELLKRCVEIFEPHDIMMIIEPMNHRIDHPGMFLHTVEQAYQLCTAVGSPSLKILYDIYHVQIEEGNLIPNIELAWDQIGYFQVGDTPGRNEPTTGEINYTNVFEHIYRKAPERDFFFGLEHGNSQPGKAGELATIEAYRTVDPGGEA